MNIADVEQRLRAAYDATDELELDAASQPLPQVKPRSRGQRDKRFAAGLAAAATVIAVVAGAAALASRAHHDPDVTAGPPSFPTAYVFGAKSVPHYVLTEQSLERGRQRYLYQDNRSLTKMTHHLAVSAFVPDQVMRDTLAGLPRIQVGSAQGRYATVGTYHGSATNRAPLDKVFGTEPDHPYTAVAWPVDGEHWAAVLDYANKRPTPSDAPRLAALAATMTPANDERVAFVKIGYLPAAMRFEELTTQAKILDEAPMRPMELADPGSGWATMSFTDSAVPPGAPAAAAGGVAITMPLTLMVPDLASANAADLPSRMAPWQKTTINGHAAWVATDAILLQLSADVQVAVTGDAGTSAMELRRIAESLSPTSGPVPLTTAVPASALS